MNGREQILGIRDRKDLYFAEIRDLLGECVSLQALRVSLKITREEKRQQ
jgi:hypothetical protein